ncbi:MAG: arylsulfatase [Spirochaetota bacterium]
MSDQPNVIIVVTDDQGYGDLGCHGNPHIRTPNMDALHAESVRFADFHVDPTCSPSRAALLTGCYSHRVNVWHTIMGRNYLREDAPTMADAFRSAGYRTGHFGKWHLGGHRPFRPIDRGFDEWLGQGDGGTGCMTDYWGNRRVDDVYLHNGRRERIAGYGPDVFFDAALEFIAQPDDRPFFVYLATYIPHDPTSIPEPSWAGFYRDHVPIETAYFYSSIERADHNLGRLRSRLRQLGLDDDTILIFMTDNGTAQGHEVFNAGMRGHKGSVYDGGHRVPCFVRWPAAGIAGGRDVAGLTAHIDLLPTLDELCSLGAARNRASEWDGISLAGPLCEAGRDAPDRTLIVESQRVRHPQKYRSHAVMRGVWRLVDGDELYDLSADPGQEHNVVGENDDVAEELRACYERYWESVRKTDDLYGRPIIDPTDPEPVVLCAEHLFPDADDALVWNQQHVLVGKPITGRWPVRVSREGTFRIECRRWPEEIDAPLRGVPGNDEPGPAPTRSAAFLWDEEVDDTLYAAQDGGVATPIDVRAIRVRAGGHETVLAVGDADSLVSTEVELPAGDQWLAAEMLDADGAIIGSVYYVTVLPHEA